MRIFLLILLLPLFSSAQILSKQNSIRVYRYAGSWHEGIIIMNFQKDTSYGGSLISRYSLTPYFKSFQDSIFVKATYEYYIDFLDSSGILDAKENYGPLQFKSGIVYDSNYIEGDSFITFIDNSPETRMQFNIVSKFTEKESGLHLRGTSVLKSYNGYLTRIDTFYDQIGYIKDFILPWDYLERLADGGIGGPLLCYYSKATGILEFNSSDRNLYLRKSCEELLKLVGNKNPDLEAIKIYPNPAVDWLNFYSDNLADFMMVDLNGKIIKQIKGKLGNTPIDISDIIPGIYLIQVNNKYIQKFVKI